MVADMEGRSFSNDPMARALYRRMNKEMERIMADIAPGWQLAALGIARTDNHERQIEEVTIKIHLRPNVIQPSWVDEDGDVPCGPIIRDPGRRIR